MIQCLTETVKYRLGEPDGMSLSCKAAVANYKNLRLVLTGTLLAGILR